MISITVRHKGADTIEWLKMIQTKEFDEILNKYGKLGVASLYEHTPKRTGLTAASWDYRIEKNGAVAKIVFTNSNRSGGIMVAILIQYGHGTGWGGYVQGIDYINPALQPVFELLKKELVNELRKE